MCEHPLCPAAFLQRPLLTKASIIPVGIAPLVKNLLKCMRPGFDPWVGKIPQRRAWQPTHPMDREEPGGLESMGLQRVEHD